MPDPAAGRLPATLRARDAVALTVGIVIGAGIFRTPSVVAGASGDATIMLLAWGLGGLIALIGALCYAELASAYPSPGGDYHYLARAFGRDLSFLYGWARLTVIQTGSIALLAFVFGDYASQLLPLGPASSSIYAALVVVGLTALNWWGVRAGVGTQNWLTVVEVLGLGLLIIAGLVLAPAAAPAPPPAAETAFGVIMVFVLLTYGGWNEAAYLTGELRDAPRVIAPVLVVSLAILAGLYLLANAAYLRALGLGGMAGSDAVAAEVMRAGFGDVGAVLISALVAISALTSANATVITGARTAFALGRDHRALGALARWRSTGETPGIALLVQGVAALALVAVGATARNGFELAVSYTAPVFWLFFLLVGASHIVLRRREPGVDRPFRTPLYPLTPLVFCAINAGLLYSSLAYTGRGALIGVGVLAAGGLVLLVIRRR